MESTNASGLRRLSKLGWSVARGLASSAWGRLSGRGGDEWGGISPETIASITATLGEMKGLPMKLAQIASFVDSALPPGVRATLSSLQRQSAPMPRAVAQKIIEDELGERGVILGRALPERPVAAASIGQVYRVILPDGRPAALKVQYPAISEALAAEFGAASTGAGLATVFMPHYPIKSYIEEVRQRLVEECDYYLEAKNQAEFRAWFAGHPQIYIPEVYTEYCSARVLAGEWSAAPGFAEWLESDPPQADRDRVGRALYEFYISALYRHGAFNADPHPGNYLVDSKKVIILDFGCVRRFDRARIAILRELAAALREDAADRLRQAMVALGLSVTTTENFKAARELFRAFFGSALTPGEREIAPPRASGLAEILESKMLLFELRFPADLLFLVRIKYGLFSTLARLGARADWGALEIGGE